MKLSEVVPVLRRLDIQIDAVIAEVAAFKLALGDTEIPAEAATLLSSLTTKLQVVDDDFPDLPPGANPIQPG